MHQLHASLTKFMKQSKILLLGDNCIDIYQYGEVTRISPEAPVPVFKLLHEIQKPGMAGNVNENLKSLNVDVDFIYTDTSTKTRIIDKKSNQHIVRIDNDAISNNSIDISNIDITLYDAIVISDYCKGSISEKTILELYHKFAGPIFIDTKKRDLKHFEGCFVKINETEYQNSINHPTNLIVTKGEKGACFRNLTYPAPKIEVVDVTGAGDTFLAVLVYEYLNTKNIDKSIKLAVKAASLAVQHNGVYVITNEDIKKFKKAN